MTAENETRDFTETLCKTVHASMYFVIPMTAGLAALSRPVVNLIYGGGRLDAGAISVTSDALRFVSLGMIGFALQTVLSRAYFARQDGKTPLISGIASIAVNIVLSILLTDTLGVTGLAVSSAAAMTTSAVILILPLEKAGAGFINKAFILDMVKMAVSAAVMTAVVLLLIKALNNIGQGMAARAVIALVPAAAGCAVYFALTSVFRVNEARSAAAVIKRRLTGPRA